MIMSEEYTYVVKLLKNVRVNINQARRKPNVKQIELDCLYEKEGLLENICRIINEHDKMISDLNHD